MSTFHRITKSVVLAAAFAAIFLVGLAPDIASAAPAQQIAANVVLTIPAGPNVGGNYDETPGQSWVWVYPVAKHGTYTGTVATAIAAHDIGQRGNAHEFLPIGNRQFRGSVDPGDYLVVAHLGTSTYVMNRIETIADGSQLPGQTHTMTWTGSGTTTGTNKGAGGTAAKTKPAAAVGTPLCMVNNTGTMTGTSMVAVGGVFHGQMAFIPATKLLTVEQASGLVNDKKTELLNFGQVAAGGKMNLPAGVYQVFRLNPGAKPTYIGGHVAEPNKTATALSNPTGACKVIDLKLVGGKTASTGMATNFLYWLMVIGGLAVAVVAIGGKFKFIPLSLPQRGRG